MRCRRRRGRCCAHRRTRRRSRREGHVRGPRGREHAGARDRRSGPDRPLRARDARRSRARAHDPRGSARRGPDGWATFACRRCADRRAAPVRRRRARPGNWAATPASRARSASRPPSSCGNCCETLRRRLCGNTLPLPLDPQGASRPHDASRRASVLPGGWRRRPGPGRSAQPAARRRDPSAHAEPPDEQVLGECHETLAVAFVDRRVLVAEVGDVERGV